jgi:hypothetical protein
MTGKMKNVRLLVKKPTDQIFSPYFRLMSDTEIRCFAKGVSDTAQFN